MRHNLVHSAARRRPAIRGRRLVFEPCERRDLLSGAGITAVSLEAWQPIDAPVPAITYNRLTGEIVVSGEWFDSGGQNDSSKPLLSLVYDDNGAVSFVVTSATANFEIDSFNLGTTDGITSYHPADPAEDGLEKLISALPGKEIPPFATTQFDEPAGSEAADTVASMSLRVAMADLAEQGTGVALSSADTPRQFAELSDPGAVRLSPAQRVRLHQGVWDRAWAFEMSGFSRPTTQHDAQDVAEPHFESAFQEFPSESPRRLAAAVTPVIGARPAATPAGEAARSTPALSTASGNQRLAQRSEPTPVTIAPQAIDQAMAADEVDLDLPPTWLGAVAERNHEIGALALAAVVARQAWLHAKPETAKSVNDRREGSHRLWPRRK